MLVPHIYGTVKTSPRSFNNSRSYDEVSFFEESRSRASDEVYTFIKDLYHWSRQNADDVRFGQNTKIGTFTFYYTVNNQQASIFTIYSDGSLWLNFGYMEKISTKEEIEEFKTQCSKINLIRNLIIEKKDKSYMSIPVVKFN